MPVVPGTSLGSYDVLAKIGSGGMGDVYRARDTKLDREVALKVLPATVTLSPDRFVRFEREARVLASLNHPNVVTIYAVEESEGIHFISMELIEGRPLGDLIAEAPLSIERVFDVITPLADALTAAHARGITHRDLKPANVMVTHDARVKVLDFGLAKVVGTRHVEESTRTALTKEGFIVGTFPYMSPEQIEGKPIDHRSDIFSLGVVMYEVVTGRRPFQGDSGPALMTAILRDTAPAIAQLRGDVPLGVAQLIGRCLAKSPADRYQDGAALVQDLRESRKQTESGGISAIVSDVDEASIAVLPFTNMSPDPENEFLADGISEEIINTLGQINGLRVAARGSAFSFKGKHVDLREVGQKLQVRTVLEGSVRKAGKRLRITAELVNARDGYQLWSERFDRELEDIFEIQDEMARTIADRLQLTLAGGGPEPLATRKTHNVKAYEAYLKGRVLLYKRGRFIQDALQCFEEAVALDPHYGLAWAGLADGRTTQGYYGLVPHGKAMPAARAAASRAVQMDGALAEAHCALAMTTLLHDFDVNTARQEFRKAMELDPGYLQAVAWFSLFVLSYVDGQFEEGIALMTPIVERDPLSGYSRRMRALLLAFSGRYDEAVTESLTAIELDPESFLTHWTLQTSYALAGRHAEAVAAGHAALAISERHPWAMMTMGTAYRNSGRRSEARALLDELTTRAETQWVSPGARASVAASAGLTDEVVALVTRAIQERDPFLMMSMGTFPVTETMRQVLRDAGTLDDMRRQLGLPSHE